MHGAEELRAGGVAAEGGGLAVAFNKLGLVVEEVDVRRAAAHGEEDDALRPSGEMRRARGEAALRSRSRGLLSQGGEGEPADAGGHRGQGLAAGKWHEMRVHHLTRGGSREKGSPK